MSRYTLLFTLLFAFALFAQLPQGGYASYDEVLAKAPSVVDMTMELHKETSFPMVHGEVYSLRYIAPNGRVRTWISSKRLWGYSDGRRLFIFENGYFSPVEAHNVHGAWFYSLAIRTSSGSNGKRFHERAFYYSAQKRRSNEVTHKYVKELCYNFPEIYAAYFEKRRRERDVVLVLQQLFEKQRTSQESVEEDVPVSDNGGQK